MNPKVSIVIPVYNGANYVADAIESALAQTYKNLEVVVVNDGSKDNGATEEAIKPYLDKIVYVRKENGGVSSALNVGIKTMTGDYFSWLSHDDLYSPDKIEKQVALIQSEHDIILCSGDLIDENKKPINYIVKTIDGRLNGRQLYLQNINGYSLNGLGFLIPKQAFIECGGFDESMRYLQDYDEWLRIMMRDKYTFVCHRDKLVHTRIHRGQQTNTISNVFDIDREKMAAKHIDIIRQATDIKDKNALVLLYYKAFAQGKNKSGLKLASKFLIECGYSRPRLFATKLPYQLKGFAKSTARNIINLILKAKGERN